jgi:C-terminal processing protease CtpA/Prc
MILEPPDPGSDYCHVSSMKDGGALANDGRVKPGDKLVRVDGFDYPGVQSAL